MKANKAHDLVDETDHSSSRSLLLDELKNLGDKDVVVGSSIYPKKSFLSWVGF